MNETRNSILPTLPGATLMATDAPTITDTVKFHLSLNVSNLSRSIEFYRVLFGCEPAKVRDDYAKFETDDPGLVLSLVPSAYAPGGALNHVGIRMTSSEELVAAQRRIEMAGVLTQREEGVECCYARQTKFWVADPDRNLWEIYVLHEDVEEHGAHDVPHGEHPAQIARAAANGHAAQPVVFQHILMQPLPERIDHADASVDEVRLEGTLNLKLEPARVQAFLQEILRVLRPGGSVMVHGLVGDRPFPAAQPTLPGPAAVVEYVPLENEPAELLTSAGFMSPRFMKFSEKACYFAEGVEMRELKLTAQKPPAASPAEGQHSVLYKGPWRQVADEAGRAYPRGQRVQVSAAELAWVQSHSEDFVVFSPNLLSIATGCGCDSSSCAS
jgi:catechol 2,3-dioxygenase-like lactoylglutathione lyase family enzyme